MVVEGGTLKRDNACMQCIKLCLLWWKLLYLRVPASHCSAQTIRDLPSSNRRAHFVLFFCWIHSRNSSFTPPALKQGLGGGADKLMQERGDARARARAGPGPYRVPGVV